VEDVKEYKWITIKKASKKGKTFVYDVYSDSGDIIGHVKWYVPWRKYCFFPLEYSATVFEQVCLMDLSNYLAQLNIDHKEGKNGG